MSERTITFSSVRETQDVLGTRGAHLADIEALFGVQAVSRDLWLRLTGPASAVQKAEAGKNRSLIEAVIRHPAALNRIPIKVLQRFLIHV